MKREVYCMEPEQKSTGFVARAYPVAGVDVRAPCQASPFRPVACPIESLVASG